MNLAELEAELVQKQDDLNLCRQMLAIDPSDANALEMIPSFEADIASIKEQIALKEAEKDATPPPPPPDDSVPPPPPKYDMSKHPKFQKVSSDVPPPPPEDTPAVFDVRDLVMAKWSEDKQWYQATIVSKTGSSIDPVYKVTFKGYGNTETKRKHEIRAFVENKKRKADSSPAVSAPQQTPALPPPKSVQSGNGTVISAAPSINAAAVVPKKEPSKVSDGPTRLAPEPKKLKGSKALEKAKSSWQDFQKTGPRKAGMSTSKKVGKESQFRTPDLPNAKVGFTGSGKPMQKDQARTTWKYGGAGEEAEEE